MNDQNVPSDKSLGDTLKQFYNDHKVLCWIIASVVVIVVVAIVVFIVLRKKTTGKTSEDATTEHFNYSLGTDTDKFTYANSFIQSVIGKAKNLTV